MVVHACVMEATGRPTCHSCVRTQPTLRSRRGYNSHKMRVFLPQRLLLLLSCLQGRRGVWVVEVQGGGRQCRALVRRGALSAAVRPTAAGLALRLFREDGSAVEQPRWVRVEQKARMGGWGTTTGV